MFGQYKRMKGLYEGVLTGKGLTWGGSEIRTEATGYGCVYFAREAVEDRGLTLKGAPCTISGSGNVAQYTAEKLLSLGGVPLTFSDSGGYIYQKDVFTAEDVRLLAEIKSSRDGRVKDYADRVDRCTFFPGERPWAQPCKYAFPSATQNEISAANAHELVKGSCKGVFEGANMPSTPEAIDVYESHGVIFAPGKAANAGGVAVSGLEMAQNAQMIMWPREEVEERLLEVMRQIYRQCSDAAKAFGREGNIKFGANVAGFLKVADTLRAHGQ